MRHSTTTLLPHRRRQRWLTALSSVATSQTQTAVGFVLLVFACGVASAQQYNPNSVRTFGQPNQAQVARDRAAIAEADNAKRIAWANYQAQLAAQRQEAISAAAEAARQRQRRASEAARLEFQRELNQQRHDAIELAAATKVVENVLKDAQLRKDMSVSQASTNKTDRLIHACSIAGFIGMAILILIAVVCYVRALVGYQVFRNPENGYQVTRSHPGLGTLCFGSLYFAALGIWTHALVSLVAAILTFGISWVIYPLFAKGILEDHYLSKGWKAL